MRIDAHQHFWHIRDRSGSWPSPALEAIHRDFMPSDLAPHLARCGIDGTVAVQSLASEADTHFLLDLADQHEFIRGVSGWIDLMGANAAARIATLAARPKLRGVRAALQDCEDVKWINDINLAPALQALADRGLVLDALLMPLHLRPLAECAKENAELKIVVDHAGKPIFSQPGIKSWRKAMADLSRLPNVSCKLSGLITEATPHRYDTVRPYAEVVLDLFGPERTIWGSDWPVLTLSTQYDAWFDFCLNLVPEPDRASIFGGNAAEIYQLR